MYFLASVVVLLAALAVFLMANAIAKPINNVVAGLKEAAVLDLPYRAAASQLSPSLTIPPKNLPSNRRHHVFRQDDDYFFCLDVQK